MEGLMKKLASIAWLFREKTLSAVCLAASIAMVLLSTGFVAFALAQSNKESSTGDFTFIAPELLGRPTDTSITINAVADADLEAYLEYGTAPGNYTKQTPYAFFTGGNPIEVVMNQLQPDTHYFYRVNYRRLGEAEFTHRDGHSFQTQRSPGRTFTFTVQADSHLDENSDLDLYRQTLANVLADAPDFHLDLGDTFMCEKHSDPLTATVRMAPDQVTVDARYAYERTNFGLITHSSPLFLINGNHEGELGWLADGTAQNIAIWATRARQQYFMNPVPDGFYSGDSAEEPFVGKRASWYAWHWGDALFVVLDPYWYTKTKSSKDAWTLTLGERQYEWLRETLSSSPATFKFVFIHNLVGGLDGQMRGGVEAAPFFEWGGHNQDGTMGFDQKRPGWSMPIHQLLVRYGVTAVFHGHDHLYAKQELDGVVYQAVPQPSAKNFSNGPNLAAEYHYAAGTIRSSSGHVRVTVSPDRVIAHYVRAWLPANETAQRKNGQVDDTWSVVASSPSNPPPSAAFTLSPTSPAANQTVQFSDASTGNPTSWSWTFGDGGASTAQHPSHIYLSAGSYNVTLIASNASGSNSASHTVTVSPARVTSSFAGNIVLGSPTVTSIKANLFSPDQGGAAFLAYGTASGAYDRQSAASVPQAATPLELTLDGLQEDTRYYYRLYFQANSESGFSPTDEYTFHTARPTGSTFTFCIQSDSHPERDGKMFHPDLYTLTMDNVLSEHPDFYFTLGDDFSIEKLIDNNTLTQEEVDKVYLNQRDYLGIVGSSIPLFLVNGNHEQAAKYLLDGTPNNAAVFAAKSRIKYYPLPVPDQFYSGDLEEVNAIGLLRDYYAFEWGDALFIVLDPYWHSDVPVDNPAVTAGEKKRDMWDITIGDDQYQWFKKTLEESGAKYKFVFTHHVLGTERGGIENAGLYEWGGYGKNGRWEFDEKRPNWELPIHPLMAKNKVTIFFQGHDHLFAHQELDGVVYQTLPCPADDTYTAFNEDAYETGNTLPNSGHIRITVSPEQVKVDYVRSFLPGDETGGHKNREVGYSYVITSLVPETVSTPSVLGGPTSGVTGASYTFTSGGSTSSLDHSVEYQFDWKGNGSDLSPWSSSAQSKTWSTAGVYTVRARARCTQDISVLSDWSTPLSVSISVPDISITPKAYDFGSVKINRSKAASFIVKNNGTVNLSINSWITDQDASMFKITMNGGSKTIKPGKTLTLRVAFKPTSTGTKGSALIITSNDPDTATIDIPLSGTGQ
jgi:PKD repeat protein